MLLNRKVSQRSEDKDVQNVTPGLLVFSELITFQFEIGCIGSQCEIKTLIELYEIVSVK